MRLSSVHQSVASCFLDHTLGFAKKYAEDRSIFAQGHCFCAFFEVLCQARHMTSLLCCTLDPGGINWCLTSDTGTIVRLMEAHGCSWVVQKYIHPPLLLSGRKCSLVVLVVVQSMEPLCAYFYRHFYARVASKQFNMKSKDIADPGVHLTDMVQMEEWKGVGWKSSHWLCWGLSQCYPLVIHLFWSALFHWAVGYLCRVLLWWQVACMAGLQGVLPYGRCSTF